MDCEKCGTEMQPVGEFLRGCPFMGCPNCGNEETKVKIKRYTEWNISFRAKHGLKESKSLHRKNHAVNRH